MRRAWHLPFSCLTCLASSVRTYFAFKFCGAFLTMLRATRSRLSFKTFPISTLTPLYRPSTSSRNSPRHLLLLNSNLSLTTWSRTDPKTATGFQIDFKGGTAWRVWTRIFGAGIDFRTSRYYQNTIATISYVKNFAKTLRRVTFNGDFRHFGICSIQFSL